MDYFWTPPEQISGDLAVIDGDEFSHLSHVMRKRVGDAICIVDGRGNAYDCIITMVDRRTASCSIQTHHHRLNEPGIRLTLAVAMLKHGGRFDLIVEKGTEIGVSSFIPLLTERTIPRTAKVERWQKHALAAMKQSGRCVLPMVSSPMKFSAFIEASAAAGKKFIPHEKISTPPLESLSVAESDSDVVVCIGPEGGFTDAEIDLATGAGFNAVSLGARRLRTETAAIVAAALSIK